MILRECIKHECLAQILFDSTEGNNIYDLFTYIELPTFDVASDAFATFQELMTRHRMLVAGFITESYDRVIPEFNKLLSSENYVTRRQSLKVRRLCVFACAHFCSCLARS
jgi:calcium binding protein 39